jgi:CRP/FNR family transcriptional regulator
VNLPDQLPAPLAILDEASAERLFEVSKIVEIDPDQYVFHLGDSCEAFFILLEGSVRVQLTSSGGREVTLYRVGSGGSCLLTTSCLFSRDQYPAEALTESSVRAIAIPRQHFQALLDASPGFREYVFDGFAQRLAEVISRIEAVALTPIDGRLAAALVELHERHETAVTHQELAVELGTAREVVSRHLKRMEGKGWVELGRGRITVLDLPALREIAESVPV